MKNYKTPVDRLVRIFKKALDSWKAKALDRQKRLRSLGIKLRDVTISRDHWKKRASEAEKKLTEIEAEKEQSQCKDGKDEPVVGEIIEGKRLTADSIQAPYAHSYPVFVIQLGVESVLDVLTGFRGAARNLGMISRLINMPVPTFNTINQWVFRLGHYLLNQPVEYRTDWIAIADMTATLGQLKCLLIIGIPQSSLEDGEIKLPLKHEDMTILHLEILECSTGDIIAEILRELSERIGPIYQIITDHGSDIKKGIDIYREKTNPNVIYTYDVTHQMALLLKAAMGSDDQYQSFATRAQSAINAIRQTELSFLICNKQRTKSRWLNIDTLINWGQFILSKSRGFHRHKPGISC
jgi:hypothetical protein